LTRFHYRRFYEKELEHFQELIGHNPFLNQALKRGETREASKGFFRNLFSSDRKQGQDEVQKTKEVGFFKGIVRVYNDED